MKLLALLISLSLPAFADCTECSMSPRGVNFIRVAEGFSPVAYKDPGGLWTIGYGHLIKPGEHFDEPLVGQPAEDLLRKDIGPAESGVNRLVTIPLKQNQFDALGSFTYNLGVGKLAGSTLLRDVNASKHELAALQFLRWVYVNGEVVRGLAVRRKAESLMYLE